MCVYLLDIQNMLYLHILVLIPYSRRKDGNNLTRFRIIFNNM